MFAPQHLLASPIHQSHVMSPHPPRADHMNMPNKRPATTTQQPRYYEIRVRGPIGPTMLAAFPELTARKRREDTVLCGSLHDQSALYGVLHQLEALGLELLEVRCLRSGRKLHRRWSASEF
jgi:hypothetical protein